MPPRDHLTLLRLPRREPRRKPPGFGVGIARNPGAHGAKITREIDQVVEHQRAQPAIAGIDPALILKVTLDRAIDEDEWRRAGFEVLAQNPGNIFVLFSSDRELRAFRERLAAFRGGPQGDAKTAPYSSLFNSIESISEVSPADRIGGRLKVRGVIAPGDIDGRLTYVVDVELWDAGDPLLRRNRADSVSTFAEGLGGTRVGEPFITSHGLILFRMRCRGTVLRAVLERPEVALIDLPPVPDLGETHVPSVTVRELPQLVAPPANAPVIGIIDSGLNEHPMLDGVVVDRIGVPDQLGTADEWGHGTKVTGIAAYTDLRERLSRGRFDASVRILSARVVNGTGGFDDTSTIPDQMRRAITALARRGCRVINVSLGDKTLVYAGGRATAWASELDALAREFDLLIVVSAGNAAAPWGDQRDQILTNYPAYLTTPANRLIDPAIAANVLTVGAIAHGNGLRDDPDDGVQVQAITELNHPCPITRSGPGVNGAIKPDLCDYGGTVVLNCHTKQRITGKHWASAGVLTLSPDYRQSLLTADTGTSFAAPRVAHKAALLLGRYPQASANLIRALLGLSASLPEEAVQCLQPGYQRGHRLKPEVRHCLGYGVPDVARALASDDPRVILLADRQELDLDEVALYAVPLPAEFRRTQGPRTIRVALAYDPPVRHTRLEYLGVRMSFHLLRGRSPEEIFEHFRRRDDGTRHPDMPGAKCTLEPGFEAREASTLQCATFAQARNSDHYGDTYYLAVFTHRRWAGDDIARQRFAVAVELAHAGCQTLYQRCSALNVDLRVRLRIGV